MRRTADMPTPKPNDKPNKETVMTRFATAAALALMLGATTGSASSQEVVIFLDPPSPDAVLAEIGMAPEGGLGRSRSLLGGTRKIVVPGTSYRLDAPSQGNVAVATGASRPVAAKAPAAAPRKPRPVSKARPRVERDTTPLPKLKGDKWIAAMVRFALNRADIHSDGLAIVARIADVLKRERTLKVIVSGHADPTGGDAINLPLSRRRAEAVKRALVDRHGIAPSRIRPRGVGSDEPLDGYDPGHHYNRRVQFGFFG